MPLFGPVLSEKARQALHRYQYRSSQSGLLDKAMNHYWTFVVRFLPLWLAPNVVTLIGGIAFMIPFTLLQLLSPDFKTAPPSWLWWLFAAGLFFYQTMDAIDGKQARRTRSSSPLGQLFDHGIDALNYIPILVASAMAMGCEPGWIMHQTLMEGALVFYSINWRARHEGIMAFGFFSVTEGQWAGILIFIMAAIDRSALANTILFTAHLPFAIGGQNVWDVNALLAVWAFLAFAAAISFVWDVYCVELHYMKNPQTTDPGRFRELFHVVAHITTLTLWNTHGVFAAHPIAFMWINAFMFSGIVHRLIVADVTHEKAKIFHFVFVPSLIIGILSCLDQKMLVSSVGFDVTHPGVVYGNLIWIFALWFGYVYSVVWEITDTLKNNLFSIPYPPPSAE